MNIIKLLGIEYKEDIISNFIVGLINESKAFRTSFFKNIVKIENIDNFKIKAHTRITTSFGIPDIIISLESDNASKLVIIENKLKAEEGLNQTLRYSNEKCIKELAEDKRIFNNSNKSIELRFLFLTLIPEQTPTGSAFENITYKNILEKINIEIEDIILNGVYKDFLKVINEFYSGLEINENGKLLEYLSRDEDSERVFIKFKNIMKDIKNIEEINMSDIGKISGSGRMSFYTKVYKANWIGKDIANLNNDKYSVTENSYDIHIEPSFDVFNNKISLPLHYETRPYIPSKRLKDKTSKAEYQSYINKRNLIKGLVHKKIYSMKDENIKTYNGSNQIAYVKINIDKNTTVSDFKILIKKYIVIIADIVDSCLVEYIKYNEK
ncbi:PD-(D/E)XK nuclease family protein [Paraclostridium bifermentans]|uniref:PD-(D/E)XK nuclease family protein n=1 Tax=Paraclostridium bifermentans TaxID=1490 RepID=A0AA44DM29_PARBF|nr:PD-(D/E)XK nuclease family protein [Paraclostridium bifermentans]MBN8048222.1 PD-(D/E)XK nuclease family protein [Paraclostridium bifermentans]NME10026.1 PD-(D/E)XK nuclease family protein [Paraclostridium bifermentans]